MSNRIDEKFNVLRKSGRKAFIAYLTAGDPSLSATRDLVLSFEKSGVDIVELGVPFSDPLADGPTIQAASQRALKKNVNIDKIFKCVQEIRKHSQIPLALMTYYNPVFHYGEAEFIQGMTEAGADGLIVPDLPPEESLNIIHLGRQTHAATVFFLSPTTTLKRMKAIIKASTGFIYYVSMTGVTGARLEIPPATLEHIRLARRLTDKPLCVGFGISDAEQAAAIGRLADGVIVGSAIIQEIVKNQKNPHLVKNVSHFVSNLSRALNS